MYPRKVRKTALLASDEKKYGLNEVKCIPGN